MLASLSPSPACGGGLGRGRDKSGHDDSPEVFIHLPPTRQPLGEIMHDPAVKLRIIPLPRIA